MIFLWAISRQYHKSSQLDCEIPNLGVQNRDGTERSLQSDHGSNGLNSEKGLNGEIRFRNKMGSIDQKLMYHKDLFVKFYSKSNSTPCPIL